MWILLVTFCFLGKCEYFVETYSFDNKSACVIAGSYNKQEMRSDTIRFIAKRAIKNKWTLSRFKVVISELKITHDCKEK